MENREQHTKYITVKEMAARWGVSERRITQMCARGEIKGAMQAGELKKHWLIPSFAKKPTDNRVRTGKYALVKNGALGNLVNTLFEADPLSKLKEMPAASVDMILSDLSGLPNDSLEALPAMWREYRRVLKASGVAAVLTRGTEGLKRIAGNGSWLRYKFVWVCNSLFAPGSNEAYPKPAAAHYDVWIFSKSEEAASIASAKLSADGPGRMEGFGSEGDGASSDVLCFLHEDGGKFAADEGRDERVCLGRRLIRMYAEPGAIVLDNVCGELCFMEAALLEGCNFIGMEARMSKGYDTDIACTGFNPAITVPVSSVIEDNILHLYRAWKALPQDKKGKILPFGEIQGFLDYGDYMYELYPNPFGEEVAWDYPSREDADAVIANADAAAEADAYADEAESAGEASALDADGADE